MIELLLRSDLAVEFTEFKIVLPRAVGGTFWSSTGTMSHSKPCTTHAIQLFGWFADVYRALREIFWLPMLTAKRLRKVLSYAPTTGIFRWKVTASSRAPVGAIAGAKNARGYRQIRIGGRPYSASRLAWLYMTGKWPNSEISYLNGQPSDTRWANLREAPSSQNRSRRKRK
jgi:HNH endonuclease